MDLGSVPREVIVLALALASVVALLQAGIAFVQRWAKRRAMRLRFERAARGERDAATLLEGLGYEVLGAQVAAEYPLVVDDVVHTARVRADYLVARRGQRFVVEVKTGALAPRIETPSTRRQLLEYRVAFAVDGVLLVDAQEGHVHAVGFPLARQARRGGTRSWEAWALGLAIGAAAIVLLHAALS